MFTVRDSNVFYKQNMLMSQFAIPVVLNTAQDVQNAVGRADLMKAIGTGIGNTAAYETGHQFFGSTNGMEDTSVNTYNGAPGCDPRTNGPYDYGFGPISWEPITAGAWQNRLGGGVFKLPF